MTDTEFLEMCRLAAGHDTGGQWTDEKADAIEAVESDPRGAVRRLLALYNAAAQEVERLRAECEIIAAGARDMAAYKDRSFAQMGDHAGRLEIERDRLRAEIAQLRASRTYDDLNAIRGIVEAVQRGDIATDGAGVLQFRGVTIAGAWMTEPPQICAVPTDGGAVRLVAEPPEKK